MLSRFHQPRGVAVDSWDRFLYAANTNGAIVRITIGAVNEPGHSGKEVPLKDITACMLQTTGTPFDFPLYLAVGPSNTNLYVTNAGIMSGSSFVSVTHMRLTSAPTFAPTHHPSTAPTAAPTRPPSLSPSASPTTPAPTASPSLAPTQAPTLSRLARIEARKRVQTGLKVEMLAKAAAQEKAMPIQKRVAEPSGMTQVQKDQILKQQQRQEDHPLQKIGRKKDTKSPANRNRRHRNRMHHGDRDDDDDGGDVNGNDGDGDSGGDSGDGTQLGHNSTEAKTSCTGGRQCSLQLGANSPGWAIISDYHEFIRSVPEFFTVECWYRPSSTIQYTSHRANQNQNQVFVSTESIDSQGFRRGWSFGIETVFPQSQSNQQQPVITLSMSMCTHQRSMRTARATLAKGGRKAHNGGWYHVASVYDGKHISLYVNGRRVEHYPLRGAIAYSPHAPFSLGAQVDKSGRAVPGSGVRGGIDEIRIWNVVRSTRQIKKSYRKLVSTLSPVGLVAAWRLDTSSGRHICSETGRFGGKLSPSGWTYTTRHAPLALPRENQGDGDIPTVLATSQCYQQRQRQRQSQPARASASLSPRYAITQDLTLEIRNTFAWINVADVLKMCMVFAALSVCLNSFGFKMSCESCLNGGCTMMCWFFSCCGISSPSKHRSQNLHHCQDANTNQQYAPIGQSKWASKDYQNSAANFTAATTGYQQTEENQISSTELTSM